MRRKKTLLEETKKIIYDNNTIKICREDNEWFFEIGKDATTDLAEGISLLLRKCDVNDPIWKTQIKNDDYQINPEKSLYWLSGGDKEWKTLEHYNKQWCDCHLLFQEEYEETINNILNKSNTFGEVRKHFIKNLNINILYEFALSKKLIK